MIKPGLANSPPPPFHLKQDYTKPLRITDATNRDKKIRVFVVHAENKLSRLYPLYGNWSRAFPSGLLTSLNWCWWMCPERLGTIHSSSHLLTSYINFNDWGVTQHNLFDKLDKGPGVVFVQASGNA